MFNFFKKSNISILAPIAGKTISLENVPDPVFSQKIIGDGVAIDSTGNTVVSPCNGTISAIMKYGNAFAITLENGVNLLIHVGLDTINLKGKGFTKLANVGDIVKAGTPILKIDKHFIESQGISLITPVIITNIDTVKNMNTLIGKSVIEGKNEILTCKI